VRPVALALGLTLAACGSADDPAAEVTPFPVPARLAPSTDATAEEQELLALANRLRANPAAEVDRLLAAPRVRTLMKTYGLTEAQLRADFAAYAPSPPLALDARLMSAARGHAHDLSEHHPATPADAHHGSDGSTSGERVSAAGYRFLTLGENVFLFAKELDYDHAAFAVDWGNDPPGHRLTLLDLDGTGQVDRKQQAGIGLAPMDGDGYGPFVLVEELATEAAAPTAYVTGVAFTDRNGDGFYQAGEGIGGADVVPASGDFHAVTGASGGYAIPFAPGTGTVKLQLQRGGKVVAEAQATIGGDNVEVDFVP
jgi:hypothetical protein